MSQDTMTLIFFFIVRVYNIFYGFKRQAVSVSNHARFSAKQTAMFIHVEYQTDRNKALLKIDGTTVKNKNLD